MHFQRLLIQKWNSFGILRIYILNISQFTHQFSFFALCILLETKACCYAIFVAETHFTRLETHVFFPNLIFDSFLHLVSKRKFHFVPNTTTCDLDLEKKALKTWVESFLIIIMTTESQEFRVQKYFFSSSLSSKLWQVSGVFNGHTLNEGMRALLLLRKNYASSKTGF